MFLLAVLPAISSCLAATVTDFNIESNALIPSEPSLPQQKKVGFCLFDPRIKRSDGHMDVIGQYGIKIPPYYPGWGNKVTFFLLVIDFFSVFGLL